MSAGPAGQLTAARNGADLVPGSPTRVLALADQLDDMAAGLATAQRLLASAPGGWLGSAADAFAALVRSLPAPYATGAAVMGSAAAQVRSHAGTLAAAQRQADEALDLHRRATALRRTPGAPSGIVPPAAADAMDQRAVAEVEQARARVRASGSVAAEQLRRAARAAPDRPNPLVRAVHGAMRLQRGFQLGAVEATVGTVTAVALYSPQRVLVDAGGWWRDVRGLGSAAGQAAAHPVRTATALADPTTLRQDPARWAGRLAPDLLLGYATGGAGAVANRGVSIPVKAATLLRRGESGDDLRAAVRAGRETSRSRLRLRDLRTWSHRNDYGTLTQLTPGQRMATAALARDARWAEHEVRSRVSAVARDLGAELVGVEHAVKGQESLFRKVSEIAGTKPIGQALPTVNDSVRYTIVADPQDYAATVTAAVQGLRARGMLLVTPKASWGGARYRGVNVTMADPVTGRLVEVQVHTPASHAASKATHRDYERFRQVGIPAAEKALLGARIAAVFAKVPTPPGALDLGERLAQLPRQTDATNRPPQLLSLDHRPFVLRSTGGALLTAGAGPGPSLSSDDDRRAGRPLQHGHQRQHGRGAP
ncbi:MAG TPA: hypothetical protein VF661_06340 [Actinomycetales bacterium]|jgi:hypothetical protein